MATTQNGRPRSNQVHLVLQGKGGVGKSFVSAVLGQYFHARKGALHCFDTDPVNATFAQYHLNSAHSTT
jgi:MinD-like ATPase involved in chromosome partitioning or flagellar assembly